MTKRQAEVLDAIRAFIEGHGFSPTLMDIAGAIGVSSPATVHKHVTVLVRDGHLRRRQNQGRSIELAKAPLDARLVERARTWADHCEDDNRMGDALILRALIAAVAGP